MLLLWRCRTMIIYFVVVVAAMARIWSKAVMKIKYKRLSVKTKTWVFLVIFKITTKLNCPNYELVSLNVTQHYIQHFWILTLNKPWSTVAIASSGWLIFGGCCADLWTSLAVIIWPTWGYRLCTLLLILLLLLLLKLLVLLKLKLSFPGHLTKKFEHIWSFSLIGQRAWQIVNNYSNKPNHNKSYVKCVLLKKH